MHVSEIMKEKNCNVITVRPNANLERAIEMLVSNKIGAVPVREPDGDVIGLLTERDIMHGIARHGTDVLEQRVDELMTKKVYHCAPGDNLKHIMSVMTIKHVRHLLVMDDNRLAAIVSLGDVIRNRLDDSQLEVDVLRDYARIH